MLLGDVPPRSSLKQTPEGAGIDPVYRSVRRCVAVTVVGAAAVCNMGVASTLLE